MARTKRDMDRISCTIKSSNNKNKRREEVVGSSVDSAYSG